MPSDRQIAANRLNAQKSTGPRTGAGKAASSANALKTGIHAESQVIRGESSEDLAALTADYYAEYHPVTAPQRALVDTLIHNEWLLRRLRRVETDLWNKGIEFLEESKYQPKNHLIGDTFDIKQETLARLQRRIDSFDRAWHRALKALRQLQADELEPIAPPDPAPRSQLVPLEPAPSGIGFVPASREIALTSPTSWYSLESLRRFNVSGDPA